MCSRLRVETEAGCPPPQLLTPPGIFKGCLVGMRFCRERGTAYRPSDAGRGPSPELSHFIVTQSDEADTLLDGRKVKLREEKWFAQGHLTGKGRGGIEPRPACPSLRGFTPITCYKMHVSFGEVEAHESCLPPANWKQHEPSPVSPGCQPAISPRRLTHHCS